jgi:hypothetical protein
MAITRIGTPLFVSGGLAAQAPQAINLTVSAAGIAAGNTIIIIGITRQNRTVISVTDAKGNVYTIRRVGTAANPGFFLADCVVANALVSGDNITITHDALGGMYCYVAFWCSTCYYHTDALATWTGTAATGGTIRVMSNEFVIGGFSLFDSTSSTVRTMTTPGSGYTQDTGNSGNSPDGYSIATRWEYKVASSANNFEAATGTMSAAGTERYGITAAYSELPVIPAMAVV